MINEPNYALEKLYQFKKERDQLQQENQALKNWIEGDHLKKENAKLKAQIETARHCLASGLSHLKSAPGCTCYFCQAYKALK